MGLIFEDETRVLRRCFFDIQNAVGLGRDEEIYHQAIKLWLMALVLRWSIVANFGKEQAQLTALRRA